MQPRLTVLSVPEPALAGLAQVQETAQVNYMLFLFYLAKKHVVLI